MKLRVKLTLTSHDERVTSADWSPDGKGIATIGNRRVQIYPTDIDELLQIAESRVTRRFAAKEKEKYGVMIGKLPFFS